MSILSEIMGNVNESNENLNKIENSLFKVEDIPMDAPKEGFEAPEGKMIYTTGGKWLGNVGQVYESLQPIDFLNSVVDSVRDSGMEFDLSKLEYNEISNGRIIEFRLPTNIISFKNKADRTDDTNMYLNFWTGFGGAARTEIGLYSHRFICENGMRIINADIDLKVKHTANMNLKALSFTKELISIASRVESTSQMWEKMNNVEVDTKTVETFLRTLAGVKKDEMYSDLGTRRQRNYDSLNEALATEFTRTGSTVWGMLNGASYYNNHIATGASNADYVLVRTGAKQLKEAQKMALELI